MPKLAAMLAAVPPEDPPGVNWRAYGFLVEPNKEPCVSPEAISASVDFATIIAPARFNSFTMNASRLGRYSRNRTDPSVVAVPSRSI